MHAGSTLNHPTAATSGAPRPSNTSASASGTPARSFATMIGAPASGQAMPSAGSFHSSVRTCCGAHQSVVLYKNSTSSDSTENLSQQIQCPAVNLRNPS